MDLDIIVFENIFADLVLCGYRFDISESSLCGLSHDIAHLPRQHQSACSRHLHCLYSESYTAY